METIIQIQVLIEGNKSVRTFEKLPIRFGRDSSNDLVLPYSFVSRFHGSIEENEAGSIVVADEGGMNGTHVRGRRVPAKGSMELGASGGDFTIDRLTVSVVVPARVDPTSPLGVDLGTCDTSPLADSRADVNSSLDEAAPPSEDDPITDSLNARTQLDLVEDAEDAEYLAQYRTSLYSVERIQPSELDEGLRALDEYRAARSAALESIRRTIERVEEANRLPLVREIAGALTDLAHDPALCELVAAYGIDVAIGAKVTEPPPPVFDVASALARQAVARAAARCFPEETPPETPSEIAAFMSSVEQLILATHAYLTTCLPGAKPPGWRTAGASWSEVFDVVRATHGRAVAEARAVALRIVRDLAPPDVEKDVPYRWWLMPLRDGALWRAFVARHARVAESATLKVWRSHCLALGGPPAADEGDARGSRTPLLALRTEVGSPVPVA